MWNTCYVWCIRANRLYVREFPAGLAWMLNIILSKQFFLLSSLYKLHDVEYVSNVVIIFQVLVEKPAKLYKWKLLFSQKIHIFNAFVAFFEYHINVYYLQYVYADIKFILSKHASPLAVNTSENISRDSRGSKRTISEWRTNRYSSMVINCNANVDSVSQKPRRIYSPRRNRMLS